MKTLCIQTSEVLGSKLLQDLYLQRKEETNLIYLRVSTTYRRVGNFLNLYIMQINTRDLEREEFII